jgi:hypothetical protein
MFDTIPEMREEKDIDPAEDCFVGKTTNLNAAMWDTLRGKTATTQQLITECTFSPGSLQPVQTLCLRNSLFLYTSFSYFFTTHTVT